MILRHSRSFSLMFHKPVWTLIGARKLKEMMINVFSIFACGFFFLFVKN